MQVRLQSVVVLSLQSVLHKQRHVMFYLFFYVALFNVASVLQVKWLHQLPLMAAKASQLGGR